MRERVEALLEEIRPLLRADGGDLEWAGFDEDGTLWLRPKGFCADCSGSMMGLGRGVEKLVMERIPEVKRVLFE